VFVELNERARIANKAKADLFISIHTNATAAKVGPQGTETYTLGMHRAADNLAVAKRENSVITLENDYEEKYEGFDPNSSESYIIFELMQDQNMEKSVRLARLIQQQMRSSAKRVDKGVFQAGFLVLRATSMPSALVELGYINNPTEEQYLTSKDGQAALARSIYNAFVQYKKTK
jgi:N-acetylmuramoyl-L-alanine amidase